MLQHFGNLFGLNADGDEKAGDDKETGPDRPADAAKQPAATCSGESSASCFPEGAAGEEEMEELDRLYRQALQAMDRVEEGCHLAVEEVGVLSDTVSDSRDSDEGADTSVLPLGGLPTGQGQTADPAERQSAGDEPVFGRHAPARLTPHQVLEAALFVGGINLTLKRLCALLREEFPPERIEGFIEELNTRYAAQGRPYEIRFGEGGYRMTLRSDFNDVRNRVFGMGPKEIKLSPEALEVLSLVAYQQPISAERISEVRGGNASSVLRQLLRRQLITLERTGDEQQTILYRTTPRFLQVFGLASLDDLPQSDDLSFK